MKSKCSLPSKYRKEQQTNTLNSILEMRFHFTVSLDLLLFFVFNSIRSITYWLLCLRWKANLLARDLTYWKQAHIKRLCLTNISKLCIFQWISFLFHQKMKKKKKLRSECILTEVRPLKRPINRYWIREQDQGRIEYVRNKIKLLFIDELWHYIWYTYAIWIYIKMLLIII